MSTAAIGMAYYNVKHLQLEQHRAWMLRAFFYVRNHSLRANPVHKFSNQLQPTDGVHHQCPHNTRHIDSDHLDITSVLHGAALR
jgi:hypothetical protein